MIGTATPAADRPRARLWPGRVSLVAALTHPGAAPAEALAALLDPLEVVAARVLLGSDRPETAAPLALAEGLQDRLDGMGQAAAAGDHERARLDLLRLLAYGIAALQALAPPAPAASPITETRPHA